MTEEGSRRIPHVRQEGGSQYGVPPPEMNPFAAAPGGADAKAHALGTSQQQQQKRPPVQPASPSGGRQSMPASNFDELAPPVASGGFPDVDALATAAGEEADRGGVTSNRWPREETLALLRIRSEMDAAFRDATPKGPLWEDVSRKLAELGYKRSAKKCREKFENVHKYYKRTKDGRAGRQDGKSYRFFTQLEALHGGGVQMPAPPMSAHPNPPSSSNAGVVGSSGSLQPTPLNAIPLSVGTSPHLVPEPMAAGTTTGGGVSYITGGINFSSNSSFSASESEEEDTEEGALQGESGKRKRRGGGGSRKMMSFFEGLMKQVMQRQEVMQEKFLVAIDKREQDRMIREEAWRREEMARVSREHELMAQERVISAARDATIIAFLEKMSGQTAPMPPAPAVPAPRTAVNPQPLSQQQAPPPVPAPVSALSPAPQRPQQPQGQLNLHHQATQASPLQMVPLVMSTEAVVGGSSTYLAPSKWPKPEVHALIKLRSGMESRYQEAGPKGPLWEEIAAGMRRMGYNRSAKRCKEKWENINKYFKKVKDSNKKRPEDAKTCPYFHQLDALYRKKILGAGAGAVQEVENSSTGTAGPNPQVDVAAAPPPQLALPPQLPHKDVEGNNLNSNGGATNNNGNRSSSNHNRNGVPNLQTKTRGNGGLTPSFLDKAGGGGSDGSIMKPGDIVNELMDQQPRQQGAAAVDDYDKLEETDSDSMGQVDDDDDDVGDEDEEDDEKSKMAYEIEYQQRPGAKGAASSSGGSQSGVAAAAAVGSFMAMVQLN